MQETEKYSMYLKLNLTLCVYFWFNFKTFINKNLMRFKLPKKLIQYILTYSDLFRRQMCLTRGGLNNIKYIYHFIFLDELNFIKKKIFLDSTLFYNLRTVKNLHITRALNYTN